MKWLRQKIAKGLMAKAVPAAERLGGAGKTRLAAARTKGVETARSPGMARDTTEVVPMAGKPGWQ